MHTCNALTLAQLLSVRDGEPVATGVARHIERCNPCTQEIARLRGVQAELCALPLLDAPAYDPHALRQRLQRREHRMRTYRYASAAAIASVAVLALFLVTTVNGTREPVAVTAVQSPATPISRAEIEPNLSALVIRSQDLESRLQRLPKRPHVERASTSVTIDSLQNRIQWVDYQLSVASDVGMSHRQATRLWQDRVQLMNSLVSVRYAEAQRTASSLYISGGSL